MPKLTKLRTVGVEGAAELDERRAWGPGGKFVKCLPGHETLYYIDGALGRQEMLLDWQSRALWLTNAFVTAKLSRVRHGTHEGELNYVQATATTGQPPATRLSC